MNNLTTQEPKKIKLIIKSKPQPNPQPNTQPNHKTKPILITLSKSHPSSWTPQMKSPFSQIIHIPLPKINLLTPRHKLKHLANNLAQKIIKSIPPNTPTNLIKIYLNIPNLPILTQFITPYLLSHNLSLFNFTYPIFTQKPNTNKPTFSHWL